MKNLRTWPLIGLRKSIPYVIALGLALGAVAVFAPLVALGLIGGGLFLFWLLRTWPTSGMIVLMAAALLTHFKVEVGPVSVRPEHVAVIAIGALWLWQVVVHDRPFRVDRPGILALVWFGVNVLATVFHAPMPDDSLRHIFRLALMVATYLVGINLLRTPVQWWSAFRWFLLLALAQDVFGLLARALYAFGINVGVQTTMNLAEPVPYGTLEEGNMFGSHSAAWLIAFLALFLAQPRRRLFLQLALLAAIGVTGLATVLSFSRGAWVALLGGLALLFVFFRPQRGGQVLRGLVLLLGLPLAVVALLALLQVLPSATPLAVRLQSFTAALSLTDATFSARLADISLALLNWSEHPWIGWGPGTFFQLHGYRNFLEAWIANQTARTLQETGVVGLLAFWGFLAAVLWGAFQGARRAGDRKVHYMYARAWPALIGLTVGLVVLQIAFQSTDGTWLSAMWIQAALLTSGVWLLGRGRGFGRETSPNETSPNETEESPARPATILFVHSSDEMYGSDVVLLELLRRLDRRRFRPLVVLPTDLPYNQSRGRLSDALREAGIPVRFLDFAVLRRRYLSLAGLPRFALRLWRGSRELARWLRAEDVQLVHANTSAVLGGALAARLAHRRLVWHVHEIITHPRWLRWLIARLTTTWADRVVVISEAAAAHLTVCGVAPAQRGKIVVIRDAVDTVRFNPGNDGSALRHEWGIRPDEVLVGMVGRIHTWKGQDVLVEAARLLRDHCPNVRFVIVGDIVPGQPGPREAVEAAIGRYRLGERVRLVGFQPDAPRTMAALDVLVLPSVLPEPFGIVLLEAMASGKPVIATAHGGPLEIVVDGEDGLLVPPADPVALAGAIERLAGDAALRDRLGAAGRARAVADFDFGPHVAAFEALYSIILRHPAQ